MSDSSGPEDQDIPREDIPREIPRLSDAHMPQDHRDRATQAVEPPDLPEVPDLSEDAQDDQAELARARADEGADEGADEDA